MKDLIKKWLNIKDLEPRVKELEEQLRFENKMFRLWYYELEARIYKEHGGSYHKGNPYIKEKE